MTEADSPNPANVFGVVADETRMTILRTLAETPDEEYGDTLTVSDLWEVARWTFRIGTADAAPA